MKQVKYYICCIRTQDKPHALAPAPALALFYDWGKGKGRGKGMGFVLCPDEVF